MRKAEITVELYKGLIYTIPERDIDIVDISNNRLVKNKQKWVRQELPEDFEDLPIDEQETYIIEENRRCIEGYWFFCNGKLTYITGDHYHYLTWFKIDSGYPDYRDADRRWFYHWDMCVKDEECIGQMYGKKRRDGYSYRICSIILNEARRTFNANYGILSKTGEDAKEMFHKLVHGFLEYPQFFKPQVQSAEDVKKELAFKTPQKRVTFKNRKTKKEISLNTRIDWKNTKQNSYDGMKLAILAADEAGKFPTEVNLEKWFNIGKTCLILGSRIIGKMALGSTVNEIEKGGQGFLNLWNKSDENEKTENGRTLSGLWRYFVPASDGMEGFIDEFGGSVVDTPKKPIMGVDGKWIKKGAREWLNTELSARKKAGDAVGYYEMKRQFPLEEKDMFITPANEKTCWDIAKIHEQIEHNNIHVIEKTLSCGYFSWQGGERDCGIVEWNPLPYGDGRVKHMFSWLPPQDERNKFVIKHGKRAPANEHIGLFTLDPYSAVNTVGNRQSKAASHAFRKFDMMGEKDISNAFVGEYWNRLKDPLLVYEDMIMQCHYFGWALLPERNIRNCNDYFRNRDYHNYLLAPPKMTTEQFIKDMNKVEDAGIANTAGQTQQQLIEYLASYISNNVGTNETTGEMGFMPFTNTLKDWLEFDIDKWTPYDLTISAMVAVVGSRAVTKLKPIERRPTNFFQKYNNRGNESRRVGE
jgi:hypothetical protein